MDGRFRRRRAVAARERIVIYVGYNKTPAGEIFNGENTFEQLAADVKNGPVVLDWIDLRSTLLNVLFVLSPTRIGAPWGGGLLDATRHRLFVAVMGKGASAFTVWAHPSYVAEKLGVAGGTAEPLSVLINELTDRVL